MTRLLAPVLALSLCACNNQPEQPTASPSQGTATATVSPSQATASPTSSPEVTCTLQSADLTEGLGSETTLFEQHALADRYWFYIDVDLEKMDTLPDQPSPSADVPSVAYTSATVTVLDTSTCRGQRFEDTQVRYKGNTTFDKPKRQYKVKFSKDNRLQGLRRLNLHSGWKDATLLRERLAYQFFQEAQVTAPRASHARVFVMNTAQSTNYVYAGLFTLVEQVDKTFLRDRFGTDNDEGNLYKGYYGWKGNSQRGFASLQSIGLDAESSYRGGNGYADTYEGDARAYRLKTNEDNFMEDYSDLAAFISSIDDDSTPLNHLDMQAFVQWLAANTLLGGWDNYWLNAQNYYLYNQNNNNNWTWIPWDYDNSLGNNFQDHNGFHIETQDIYYGQYLHNTLISRVMNSSEWRLAYEQALSSLLDELFTEAYFQQQIDILSLGLSEAAQSDEAKQYTDTEWLGNQSDLLITYSDEDGDFGNQAHHLGIMQYVVSRRQSVLDQLSAASN